MPTWVSRVLGESLEIAGTACVIGVFAQSVIVTYYGLFCMPPGPVA